MASYNEQGLTNADLFGTAGKENAQADFFDNAADVVNLLHLKN